METGDQTLMLHTISERSIKREKIFLVTESFPCRFTLAILILEELFLPTETNADSLNVRT